MLRKRTTGSGVSGSTGRPQRPVNGQVLPEWQITRSRLARAVIELARERRRLAHVPTMAQLRMMAGFEGREPSTYRLDPAVNWLPECLPVDFPHGADGLRITHAYGESVLLPNGCGFSLD